MRRWGGGWRERAVLVEQGERMQVDFVVDGSQV